jgi:diaminopimelate epimerase
MRQRLGGQAASPPGHTPLAVPAAFAYIARMDGDSRTEGQARDLRFLKMHGLGNDFVVIDARHSGAVVTPALARALGDRNRGVGFDQLAVIRNGDGVAAEVDFWNADGSLADACGNATRCVARLLMAETGTDALEIRTGRGVLRAEAAGEGLIRVNMGPPELAWDRVPLARDMPLDPLPIEGAPAAVGMGNPHCVFVVADAEAVDVAALGARIEHHPLFPERTNVEFVKVIDPETIRMRVWERGGMVTLACGSGACAAAVVTAQRGLTGRRVTVRLDGGDLLIDWREDGVWMTCTATLVFEGRLSADFLGALA